LTRSFDLLKLKQVMRKINILENITEKLDFKKGKGEFKMFGTTPSG